MITRPLKRWARRALAATMAALVFAGVMVGAASSAQAASQAPCDVFSSGGTPCVAAYSMVRAMYGSYDGPLYQIERASDGTYLNIGLLAAGGYVNSAPQVSFCADTICTVTELYDQSSEGNNLPVSVGGYWAGPGTNGADVPANAMALPVTANGHSAFGLEVNPGVGYRTDDAAGVATGDEPEGIYEVTSDSIYNNGCCFDFGSGETSNTDTGAGHMNAIYWGNACWTGTCTGTGPWVEADLENGLYSNATNSAGNTSVQDPFVSAWEKNNGTTNFTLKYGNAQTGGLTTEYSGALPSGYDPMHEEASILLGVGGDNSHGGDGTFFEGAMTSGYPTDATEAAVQANIVTADYAYPAASTGAINAVGASKCLDVPNSSDTASTQVDISTCTGASNQQWTHTTANQVTVYSGTSQMCLDGYGKGLTAGTKVDIYPCNQQTNQQWSFNANGTITEVQSGLCLDVNRASTANGALVQLWTCNGGSNQQWKLG